MALTQAIVQAQQTRRRGRPANDNSAQLARLRLDELAKIAGIPEQYERADRHGNLKVEAAFATAYQLVNTEREREAVVRAFLTWQEDERAETNTVRTLSRQSFDSIKRNNSVWIDGAAVPAESEGAA